MIDQRARLSGAVEGQQDFSFQQVEFQRPGRIAQIAVLANALLGKFESGRQFATPPGLVGSTVQPFGRLLDETAAAVQQKYREKNRRS